MTDEDVEDLLRAAQRRALHIEMRDTYGGTNPEFAAWQKGERFDPHEEYAYWAAIIGPPIERGADVRRIRIVSEPVSDYIRWEHLMTPGSSLAAGEKVRWLSRRRASDLALPGNDFWLVDDQLLFLHFDGDGTIMDRELVTEPEVVKFCASAFEAVWERAIDHDDYQPS